MAQHRRKPNKRRPWQKRYLSPKAKVWIAVAAVLAAVIGLLVLAFAQGWLPSWREIFAPQPQETAPTEPPKPDTVIQFVAGGNVDITDGVVTSGAFAGGYDYSDVLLDVTPILAGADMAVLNFEGNLAGEPYGGATASAPQALVESLKNAGVDLLQTANSKAVENGLLGIASTLQGIHSAGLDSLGTYASAADFEKSGGYLMREVGGIRIALVAFTKGMDGRGLPQDGENCVNLLYEDYSSTYQKVNEEGITRVLEAVQREQPDITIAMLHWGSWMDAPISKTQTKIVELMGSLGVDAIIGTHSHYVQKMGFDEKTGMFVAYSLGDFLGDGKDKGTEHSVLLQLQITKSGRTGETSITGFEAIPIYRLESDEGLRLVRIRQAVEAYENRYIGAVSQEAYEAMKAALQTLEKKIG